jgi:hypothetical protein
MAKEQEEKDDPPQILVPISLDRLLGIEHRLTRLELGMAILGTIGALSFSGIVALVVELIMKGGFVH